MRGQREVAGEFSVPDFEDMVFETSWIPPSSSMSDWTRLWWNGVTPTRRSLLENELISKAIVLVKPMAREAFGTGRKASVHDTASGKLSQPWLHSLPLVARLLKKDAPSGGLRSSTFDSAAAATSAPHMDEAVHRSFLPVAQP